MAVACESLYSRVESEVQTVEGEHGDTNRCVLRLQSARAMHFTHQSLAFWVPVALSAAKQVHQRFRYWFRER